MALRMKRHLMDATNELRIEPIRHRIRAFVGEQIVVDTTCAMLVWEPRRIVPVFGVPVDDIEAELIPQVPAHSDLDALPPILGPMEYEIHTTEGQALTLGAGGRALADAAFAPTDPDLDGFVTLNFAVFTRWMEEEQPLVGHPHDPFKRIDVLATSRHVTVTMAGQVLADTTRPAALLETHLPIRWYLPREDVRMDLLAASETESICAYKGFASYFSLADDGAGDDGGENGGEGRDIAWTYVDPLHDALPVKDRICFWAERTDLLVDGEPVGRPVTPWSTPEEQRNADEDAAEFG